MQAFEKVGAFLPLATHGCPFFAEFSLTENGKRAGTRHALSRNSLVGLHLSFPRSVGASGVFFTLFDAGGQTYLRLPFQLTPAVGGKESYSLLLAGAALVGEGAPRLFTVTVEAGACVYYLLEERACGLVFSPDATEGKRLSLAFPDTPAAPAWAHGACVLPIAYEDWQHTGCLFCGRDGDFDGLFSFLASRGIHALLVYARARDAEDGGSVPPTLWLPDAARRAAERYGVRLLCDFLSFCGVFRGSRICEGALAPAALFGEDGYLALARRLGFSGLWLRGVGFGEGVCRMIAEKMQEAGEPPLLWCDGSYPAAQPTPLHTPLHGALDGRLSAALIAYLVDGVCEPLRHFFEDTLASAPLSARTLAPLVLSEVGVRPFTDTLQERGVHGQDTEALWRLGVLISLTLPGAPLIESEPFFCQDKEKGGALAFLLRSLGVRAREGALRAGECHLLRLTPELLVFSREREGEILLTVVNRADRPITLSSPDDFFVLLGGRGRKRRFTLPEKSGTVLRLSAWQGEGTVLQIS